MSVQINQNLQPKAQVNPREWWKIRFFNGMTSDVKRRLPFYCSDWRDAWDYRVVPATLYIYFANILPALAFSLDMFTKTDMIFGVNEVLVASILGSVVFSFLAAQPLVIVGVTGPITVFNYTVYEIMSLTGIDYLSFMTLIGLWSMVMHWVLAITNSCNCLKYVTKFSCDIFGFYVAFIYIQKGIQVITQQKGDGSFYLSIVIALLFLAVGYACSVIGTSSLFQHHVRTFIDDYGTPLTLVFFTGFVQIGKMKEILLETLPVSKPFLPTMDRKWIIPFWNVGVGDVLIAAPFAILLTILFYFDHNGTKVSSLIAQDIKFPLRKPSGFHWDIFLLGFTTGIAGILGIPFPNGLIPQAPFHTKALCVFRTSSNLQKNALKRDSGETNISYVVEQRVSNLAHGILTLLTMTQPLLTILHLIPQGVLAGLFFVMGLKALQENSMTNKIAFLIRDRSLISSSEPLLAISNSAIWKFTSIQLLGFAATFAITQTIAAVGFPVFIFLLIPIRIWILPKWLTDEELRILDGPTVSSFTLISVGANNGVNGELCTNRAD